MIIVITSKHVCCLSSEYDLWSKLLQSYHSCIILFRTSLFQSKYSVWLLQMVGGKSSAPTSLVRDYRTSKILCRRNLIVKATVRSIIYSLFMSSVTCWLIRTSLNLCQRGSPQPAGGSLKPRRALPRTRWWRRTQIGQTSIHPNSPPSLTG